MFAQLYLLNVVGAHSTREVNDLKLQNLIYFSFIQIISQLPIKKTKT